MACYRLKRPWALRGWDKLPYALVDADAKRTLFVSRPEFEALALCDGSVDTDWGFVAPATRDLVRKIAERGFVEPCADGASVEDWQRYRTYDCRYVKMAHWSVTGRCNYRCKHCYMSAPDAKYGELSHETCMCVIDELADCGVYRMSITGGEPLVRADFWELVDHMLERGMRIMVIYSNGALVDDAFLDGLEARGIRPEINHVSFGYPQETPGGEEARGPAVIDDLSLEIAPGEYVGICGTSGCGKSTLMRLMLGFERPWSGQVSFDGQALDAVNLRALRRQIGTVQQNARLMAGSIFQNISVCAPGLTEEQAWEAAEAACLADDIRAMPMKMNTMVSEGGGGLSGGQRQRLLIARALAAKPRIVFMDEATSALDNVAQAQVARSLDALRCTRVVIAHRLSTIRDADLILVMRDGDIVEQGTHDQLIEKGGFYADLYNSQFEDVVE